MSIYYVYKAVKELGIVYIFIDDVILRIKTISDRGLSASRNIEAKVKL